jgi:hypothetical protein
MDKFEGLTPEMREAARVESAIGSIWQNAAKSWPDAANRPSDAPKEKHRATPAGGEAVPPVPLIGGLLVEPQA